MSDLQLSTDRPLRIGTRGSPLAIAQAEEARDRLMAAHGLPQDAFAIVVIKTTGDRVLDRPLAEIGGKGLFTKEIEDAMLSGEIDIAVHSMKDMPVQQPEGLVLECYLPREDERDAFVSLVHGGIDDLPWGAVVGTSSLRRKAQLKHRRPDLKVVEFRGNVQTRLGKLRDGVAEATFLAMAGLTRLRVLNQVPHTPMDTDDMLPAIAQGAIGLQCRESDEGLRAALAAVHDAQTGLRLAAERAFLAGLDGSCQTPIGGLAELDGSGGLRLRGQIVRPDGSESLADEAQGPAADGAAMGAAMAAGLRGRAAPGFFSEG